MPRRNISSGTPFEPIFGYSRAVRVGNQVFVSGTVGWRPDNTLAPKDQVYAQASQAIANIASALQQAGAGLRDVVRTRVYLIDADRWQDVARAHSEAFGEIMPATSLLIIKALASPDMAVEIEADAVIDRDYRPTVHL